MSHILLFEKPARRPCTLAVTGVLPQAKAKQAYRGTLDITGAIGMAKVVDFSGNTPPGTKVDVVGSQVVVTWPRPSKLGVVDVPNKDFEDGDTGWDKGPGFTITDTPDVDGAPQLIPRPDDLLPRPPSKWVAQFADFGGISSVKSKVFVPIRKYTPVTASFLVNQGVSAPWALGARVVLEYWTAKPENDPLDFTYRNKVFHSFLAGELSPDDDWRGDGWKRLTINAAKSPVDGFVRPALSVRRVRQNYPGFVDNFQWDYAWNGQVDADLGTKDEKHYHLTTTVRDDNGCTVTWRGGIFDSGIYLTSGLYPVEAFDAAQAGGAFEHGLTFPGGIYEQSLASASFAGGSLNATIIYGTYDHPQSDDESASARGAFAEGVLTAVISYGRYDVPQSNDESAHAAAAFSGGQMQVVISYGQYHYPMESVSAGGSFAGGTLS